MPKQIEITMPDGSVWAFPASLVAERRAGYYAAHDTGATSGEAFDEAYSSELEYALGHDFELTDWAGNNMDWSDVSHAARQIAPPPAVDFEEGWTSGEMRVVDISQL